MDNNKVSITVELSNKEAEALGFFLRRVTFSDYLAKATNSDQDEANLMQWAGERIRGALGEEGFDVR